MIHLPIIAIITPAALAVVAMALLAFALRGRRADEHPYCRKCGFDLFGKPAASAVCSECGADLNRRRAVRIGRRERRRGVLAVAVPALLLSGGWLGVVGWTKARAVDWDRHKPVWWLARDAADAGGRDAARRDAALAELTRRLSAGELTYEQLALVADRGLAHQADATATWVPAWGDWMEKAHRANRLPDDRWRRYARQAVRPRLVVPPVIRRGEPLTVIAFPEPARMAGGRWFATRLRLAVVAVDGAPVSGLTPARVPTGGLTDFEQELIGGWSGCVVFSHRYQPYIPPAAVPPAAVAALADGPHTVRCTYQLRISDRVGKYAPLIDETVVLTAPFTLLPADPAAPTPAGPVVGAGDKADVGS